MTVDITVGSGGTAPPHPNLAFQTVNPAFPNVDPAPMETATATVTGGGHGTHVYGEDGAHSHGDHAHIYGRPLTAGDRVVCGFLHGDNSVAVVLSRLA